MRRTILVFPNLLGATPEDSPLLQKLDSLRTMAELGELSRLAPIPTVETPEVMWLGMRPEEGQMRQGPLTVAALGYDPPDRSIHFHVSLLGLQDHKAIAIPGVLPDEDLRQVVEQSKKLDTRTLTFLPGENLDHALVWEGYGEMQTLPPDQILSQGINAALPQGDAERELRRFIDDSINLLSELELNERRLDEGLPPINLLWPWGQGIRKPVPNLFFKRGEQARVESGSMRLAGLTRLAGYKHGDRRAFGNGTNTRLDALLDRALSEDVAIFVVQAPEQMRTLGQMEELHWFLREVNDRLIAPLFDKFLRADGRIAILTTGPSGGLSLQFETRMNGRNPYPFDERSLEEKSLPVNDIWITIEQALKPRADSHEAQRQN